VKGINAFGPPDDTHRYTPIKVSIDMPKKTFETGEDVEGTINIENTYMAALPAIFQVKIIHGDKTTYDFLTSVQPLIPGTTRFSFKEFGFPRFNVGEESAGEWRITIVQKDVDPTYSETVDLMIKQK
jgi:hypothetical protein